MNEINYPLMQPFQPFPPFGMVGSPVLLETKPMDTFEQNSDENNLATDSKGAFENGVNEVKMHTAATILMGVGSLAMNFIPALQMSWKMASRMAVANMLMMVLIAFGLGAYNKSTKGEMQHNM